MGAGMTVAWSHFMGLLRLAARRLSVSASLHKCRQLVHFGPWRWLAMALIRTARPCQKSPSCEGLPEADRSNAESALAQLDLSMTLAQLERDGFSYYGSIAPDLTDRLVSLVQHLPPEEYLYVHQVADEVSALAFDPMIWRLLRRYFGCEPVLLESSLFVSRAEESMPVLDQHKFHFDYAGWQSLNVFVYLTDVTEADSYHQVIKGSHRHIGFMDIVRGTLPPDQINARFEGCVHSVFGPKGSLFFENTEAFHRRARGNSRRVMLNLLYASHRGWISHGRASVHQIARRDDAFQLARQRLAAS